MLVKTLGSSAVLAMAVGFWAWAPLASQEKITDRDTLNEYRPIQSIGYDLGSKLMSGYFVQHDSSCVVTLMLVENHVDEGVPQASAARVRLMLNPGQIAGLDSEEGHSLNVTCGAGGATLTVDSGSRDVLVERQMRSSVVAVAAQR